MTDNMSREARSRTMSRIRSKHTKVELAVRKALHKKGMRYRIHYPLPGKPDIVFPKQKLAVFIDGDFWHGYNWKIKKEIPPKEYWQAKIKGNMARDKKNNKLLVDKGWKVLRFWEHEVKQNLSGCIRKIIKAHQNRSKN